MTTEIQEPVLFGVIEQKWYSVHERLPSDGEWVLVRTDRYQTMAYYEAPEIWRLLNGRVEERPVIKWQKV